MHEFLGLSIAGLSLGAIYAISATGLVVTYTTSGVFNFAHGAVGMLMAFLYWQLRVSSHLAAPVALVLTLLVAAPLLGMALERGLIRHLDAGDTGVTLVVTIGVLVASIGAAFTIWEPTTLRTIEPFFGPSAFITLAGIRLSYQNMIALGLAAAVAVGLRLLFFRTRIGIAIRGVVDDRPLMALNGGRPAQLNALSWALGASLGALAGILQAATSGLDVLNLTFLVINGFAAAMLGRLKNLPLTFAGAIILGLLDAYVTGYVQLTGIMENLRPVLPTLFLFAILLLLRPVRLRAGAATVSRALPVPSGRLSLANAGMFVVGAVIVIQLLHGTTLTDISEGVSLAIVGLSIVLLTGYGGQISLGQYAFMGFGAWMFAKVAPGGGILGLLAVAAGGAVIGALVALPALRLRGLYLALSTLAFSQLAYYLFFEQDSVMGGADLNVPRVHLPFLSLAGDHANLAFECVVFAVMAVGLLAIRRSGFGRLLAAAKDSQAACATLGANLTATKLAVFALSSAIAAVGGALYGATEGSVTAGNFEYISSLIIVLIVYIWGVSSPSGALAGGVTLSVFPLITAHLPTRYADISLLGTGLAALSLARYPNGTVGQISDAWQRARARQGGRRRLGAAPSARAGEVGRLGASADV